MTARRLGSQHDMRHDLSPLFNTNRNITQKNYVLFSFLLHAAVEKPARDVLGALQSQSPGVNIVQNNGFLGSGFKVKGWRKFQHCF